jgi:16S rRNA processing protein RimM
MKPHGTKGEVFVWPLTDEPDAVFGPGSALRLGDREGVLAEDAPVLVVKRSRPFKRGMLVSFEGVGDRDVVGSWWERCLLAPRASLTAPEEGEAYYHELIGLEVVTVAGEAVGWVVDVYEAKPADLLEVEAEDGRRRLIPYSKQVVREVAVAEGRLVIEPPPGLLEL